MLLVLLFIELHISDTWYLVREVNGEFCLSAIPSLVLVQLCLCLMKLGLVYLGYLVSFYFSWVFGLVYYKKRKKWQFAEHHKLLSHLNWRVICFILNEGTSYWFIQIEELFYFIWIDKLSCFNLRIIMFHATHFHLSPKRQILVVILNVEMRPGGMIYTFLV